MQDLDPHKTPPLVSASSLAHLQRRLDTELPARYGALPVFSLHHHKRQDLIELVATGAAFLERVRRRGAEAKQPALYDQLVRLWGGPSAGLLPLNAPGLPEGPEEM